MKKILMIISVISLLIASTPPAHGEQLTLQADSYILIDSKSGQVLYEHNADKKLYPASTTKVLTAVVAIEKGNPEQLMTASKAAVNDIGKDGMNIGIMPEEQIKMDDLLKALLIRSANETGNIIAENICSTRQEFMDLMNKRAAELGATSTHFTNPCGAHDKEHYTTARDMAKIAMHAMTLPMFREIVSKRDFVMQPTNKHAQWPVMSSTNHLLGYRSDYYTTVTGIKTGYTDPAGNCLVSSAVDASGMELISVVMGVAPEAGRNAVFKISNELLEYGFKNYSIQKLVGSNEVMNIISVNNSKDDDLLEIVTQNSLESVLPIDAKEHSIFRNIHLNTPLTAPINKGDVVGEAEFMRNGIVLGKVALVAARSIEKKPEVKKVVEELSESKLLENSIITAAVILAAFFILRTTLRTISRRRRNKRNL